MNYSERLAADYEALEALFQALSDTPHLRHSAGLIFNLYPALREHDRGNGVSRSKDIILYLGYCALMVLRLFVQRPYLKETGNIVLVSRANEADSYVAERLGLPASQVQWRISAGPGHRWKSLLRWLRIVSKMLVHRGLERRLVLACAGDLLQGMQVSDQMDLERIRSIITMHDRYPVELAVIRKANAEGKRTIRYDYYFLTDNIAHRRISCKTYFYPNEISRKNYAVYEQNKNVEYVSGGYPYWDIYAEYPWNPQSRPRIVTFYSQHGYEVGVFGPKPPSFYARELLECLPEDCLLHIKLHPAEDGSAYSGQEWKSPRLKIIQHGEMDNLELLQISSFTCSIASTFTFQAKLVCPQSFFINYWPLLVHEFRYQKIESFMDVISSKDELRKAMSGDRRFISLKKYLQNANPMYPGSCDGLKALIRHEDSIQG